MNTEERRELEMGLLEKTRDLLRYAEEHDAIPSGGFLSIAAWPDHLSVTINKGTHKKEEPCWTLMVWADPRNAEMEVCRS